MGSSTDYESHQYFYSSQSVAGCHVSLVEEEMAWGRGECSMLVE